jgi:tetratricopeptide (TPR) repeat protein
VIRLAGVAERDPNGNSTVSVAQLKVPERAAKAYAKAQEAFHKNKRDEARSQVDKALQLFPRYAQALTLRGLLYLDDQQPAQAIEPLEQAIKYDFSYGMGYVVLGAAYNLLARYDDAQRSLQRGVALLPTSWQAQFELSKAELGKGQFSEALRHVNRAGDLAPAGFPAIHLVRAHALLGLKNYTDAITELERYLGGESNSVASAKARETLNRARAFAAATPGK